MYKVVVAGIGRVASEILEILLERDFPLSDITVVSGEDDIGKKIHLSNFDKTFTVKKIDNFDFSGVDFVFFAAGSTIAEQYAQKIADNGGIAIDCSSFFRLKNDIPLVIPEINSDLLIDCKTHAVVASPNCTAVQMLLCLAPLHKEFTIKRIVVSTYQSVSGAGTEALDELFNQTKGIFVNDPVSKTQKIFNKQIAFNIIPHIGDFNEEGSTTEEEALILETKKILEANVEVTATCARVPVFIGHCMSINVEFHDYIKDNISKEDIKSVLSQYTDSIAVIDYNTGEGSVTPFEVAGEDKIFVSRIRRDNTNNNTFNLWIVADNLRKGAALNMVQIAEAIISLR